jgi:hypothetical protein
MIFIQREGDESGPAGVDAKAEGGGFHGTSMEKEVDDVEEVPLAAWGKRK